MPWCPASLPGAVVPIKALVPSEGQFPEGAMPALLWACVQQRVTGRLDLAAATETDRSVFLEDGQAVALRDRVLFSELDVETGRATLAWDNGSDFSPEYLYNKLSCLH